MKSSACNDFMEYYIDSINVIHYLSRMNG